MYPCPTAQVPPSLLQSPSNSMPSLPPPRPLLPPWKTWRCWCAFASPHPPRLGPSSGCQPPSPMVLTTIPAGQSLAQVIPSMSPPHLLKSYPSLGPSSAVVTRTGLVSDGPNLKSSFRLHVLGQVASSPRASVSSSVPRAGGPASWSWCEEGWGLCAREQRLARHQHPVLSPLRSFVYLSLSR